MTEQLHLGDEVVIVTDRFAEAGTPQGSVGYIVDDWADGSNDVEVTNPDTGLVVARVRAALGEIELSTKHIEDPDDHKPGFILGRGDALDGSQESAPPPEGEIESDVPWELQEPPQTGPILI